MITLFIVRWMNSKLKEGRYTDGGPGAIIFFRREKKELVFFKRIGYTSIDMLKGQPELGCLFDVGPL